MSGPGIVVVDKPPAMTSHDVVGRCRRIFSTRRVGHAGTLDPMATGVLVIGVERATKILGLLSASSKSYAATIRLGQSTSTDDAEGEPVRSVPAGHLTAEAIGTAVEGLRGDIAQVPSTVSAIKVGGKRAYRLAREGHAVELEARPVRIDRFDVRDVRPGPHGLDVLDVDVEVECSSGTYRAPDGVAPHPGRPLRAGPGVFARRARGHFGLDQAYSLDELAERPRLSYSLDEACLLIFPRRELSAGEADAAANGRSLPAAGIDGVYAACDPDGRVVALLRDEGARTKSVVVVRPATL
ncbi:tRNA pseudouridine(55) synthase TruB [Mycobacterium intracellulare subsp. chimaera]|uniref:tRNA pseudouridine(55) synthase TruB n=1 Tax=Mycobacterium intracellulare TaxID=1767 RepID=UPI000909DD5F|nr:tRNA pseudouridine(55) synthase TruB [Mycobacterium intracellulare]AOS94569.2 tRNA pseudouridine(55) synthase TruB [Mycobacterium intracellulare subsp. chimaera]